MAANKCVDVVQSVASPCAPAVSSYRFVGEVQKFSVSVVTKLLPSVTIHQYVSRIYIL